MGLWDKAAKLTNSSNDEHRKAQEAKGRGDTKAYKRHMKAATAFGSEARDVGKKAQQEREARLRELDRQRADHWRKQFGN